MSRIVLDSDRLIFRLIEESDLKAIHDLHALPESSKFNTIGIPLDIEETRKLVEPWIAANLLKEIERYTFALELKSNNQFIGLFGFNLGKASYKSAEVWYKIHPIFWNKGFATEALKAIINFGFDELNLHRIHAGCAVENLGSIRVIEKAGMTNEGRRRQILPLPTGWSDNFEYAILENDPRSY